MEKDTIFIDLDKYNVLRDFRREIMAGKVFVIDTYTGYKGGDRSFEFLTESEVVAKCEKENKKLAARNKKLEEEAESYRADLGCAAHTLREARNMRESLKNLSKMNIVQFLSWKRKY